jgi:hypothetical protein
VTVEPFWVAENTAVPAVFDDKLTVSAVVVGFPNWSCSWTVIGPKLAVEDAAPDTADDVNTSLLAAAAVMVSDWVPLGDSPVANAVISGDPATVSP